MKDGVLFRSIDGDPSAEGVNSFERPDITDGRIEVGFYQRARLKFRVNVGEHRAPGRLLFGDGVPIAT